MEKQTGIDFAKEARERIERIRQAGGSPSQAAAPENPPVGCADSTLCTRGPSDRSDPERGSEPEAEQLQMPPALMPNCMSREEWTAMERSAAKGLMPDETVTRSRRMLYFVMVGLYAAVAAGVMPAAVAKAEKRMAIEAYNRQIADDALRRSTGDFYRKVEAASTAYAKRACFDNAEALHKAVCSAMPKMLHREADFGGDSHG